VPQLSVARRYARFVRGLTFGGVPAPVVAKATSLALDTLGSCLASSKEEFGRAVVEAAERLGGPQESTLIGTKAKTGAASAVLANATLAHGLDFDGATQRLFCACDAGVLVTLDRRSGKVLDEQPLSGMPDVVFFGDMVPKERVLAAMSALEESAAMLVVGSSLTVFSGYRFCLRAKQLCRPIAAINLGRTRADEFFEIKVKRSCGETLTGLAERLSNSTRGVPA